MTTSKLTVAFSTTLLMLLAVTGCDQKPAVPSTPSSADKPAQAPPAASADDLESAGAILKEEAKTAIDMSQLPPGHPPMGTPAAKPATPTTGELPPGHPPMEAKPAMPRIPTPKAPGKPLQYDVPEAWESQPPANAMRKAQFVLPGAAEGVDGGELIVYYLGPNEGGSVADNLARWRSMFVDQVGEPVGDDAVTQETFEANGLKVTTLVVTGAYRESVMPGVAPSGPKQAARQLLAAIIETDDGPWFFKAVGPADTMKSHRENFDMFVRSVKH